jgi:hypothetical protein
MAVSIEIHLQKTILIGLLIWLHYNPSFVGGYVGSRNEHVGAIIQKRSLFFRLNGGQRVESSEYLQNLGLVYSSAGVIGDSKLNSGRYTQLNGKTGNFNDRPFKQLSQWGKANKGFAQNLSRVGKLANGLVFATAAYDLLDDGNVKTSTMVNAGLMTLAITVPITAPFVLAYGILDYAFNISGYIDANSSGINTGIYGR